MGLIVRVRVSLTNSYESNVCSRDPKRTCVRQREIEIEIEIEIGKLRVHMPTQTKRTLI